MSEQLMETMEKELNASQKEAVYFNNGPLLVIAGAGSGKTKTLTYRVARLIHEGIQPESILLLTFTRKAAEEMLNRATTILDERCANVSGGTFHAFAHIALRKYAPHIGFDPQFTIMDRSDSEDLIQRIRKEKNLANKKIQFTANRLMVVSALPDNNGQLICNPEDRRFYIAACPGAPHCVSATINTKQLADSLSLAGVGAARQTVHISGCPKGCAATLPRDICVVGLNSYLAVIDRGCAWDSPSRTGLSRNDVLKYIKDKVTVK